LAVAFQTPFLRFLAVFLALFLLSSRPPWLLRRSLPWRNGFLARLWPLLPALRCPLLRLPARILDCRGRGSLLRRGLRWGWFLQVRASPLRWL